MINYYAAVPLWNKAESVIIPAGTADIDYWADKAAGGADASTNAARSGVGGFWSVQGLHVNLDVDGIVIVSVMSMDTDKTTALETIPFRFNTKGTYIIPVMWRAAADDKYLKIDLNGDGTASVYVRAFGVKVIR